MKAQYRRIRQKPLCCLPTCLQMILDRHGFKQESQATILYKLGLIVVPREKRASFRGARLRKRSLEGFYERKKKGHRELVAIRRYFARERIPFVVKARCIDSFSSSDDFRKYLITMLRKGNDIMLRFCTGFDFYDNDSWTNHVVLLLAVNDNRLTLLDPYSHRVRGVHTLRIDYFMRLMKLAVSYGRESCPSVVTFSRR